MKIAFVVPGFSADENDWCIPAHTDIVRALAQEHEVHVYTLRYPRRVDTYRIGNGVVHSFGGAKAHGVYSAALWRRVFFEIKREHARRAFDVMHAIFGGEAGCLNLLVAKYLRVPALVWLVNGELVGLPGIGYGADLNVTLRWMNQIVLRHAAAVLCGCEAMTDAARARMNALRRARAQTLPLGVDTTRFFVARDARRNTAPIQFVNAGSLLPVKDQLTLLSAFALVLEKLPRVRLMIAGTGPLENALRARIDALQLGARVTLAGHVPHDEMPALYQNAEVFVQASLHEGQGMALLEAAACGCAVCGTNVGALRDVARKEGAVACAVGGADALAEAMVTAWRERAARGACAEQIAAREYSVARIAARLSALYQAIEV